MDTPASASSAGSRVASKPYYGWAVLLVAAAAMVGTLPGRTQGLGLITEPLTILAGIIAVLSGPAWITPLPPPLEEVAV